MNRSLTFSLVLLTIVSLGAFAQVPPALMAEGEGDLLARAQQVMAAAETAGAPTVAKTLYDDALWRLRTAQANWNANKRKVREDARLRAEEALWAGRAALAKSQWLGTNTAIRGLQADIARFGGRSDLTLEDESPTIEFDRGMDSRSRGDVAQRALDQAKAAGGEQIAPADLKIAQDNLKTVRKITKADKNNESADHLSYVSEMRARRAYYLARATQSGRYLANLQLERTRLAQSSSEAQAAAERAQREQAQLAADELQRRLVEEQANRQAQAVELDRLRQQIDENRRSMELRVTQDRAAREETERRLDDAIQHYQTALATSSSAEAENLRRQVEDQQIALRAMQERERLNEQTLQSQIETLRGELQTVRQQGTQNSQVLQQRELELARRQQELDTLKTERQADLARRTELETQQQSAIAEAQRRRQDAERQAQALQQQLDEARLQAQTSQIQLDKTREELAQSESETRRLRMQQELSQLAATRSDSRGLIVTLPGIFFDTGKSELKPGARNTLTRIADQLKDDDTISITIEGHTDSLGNENSNQTLSERRASAVRDFLVSVGLPANRISVTGKGEADPVTTNKTATGRQQNRRVELVITNQ